MKFYERINENGEFLNLVGEFTTFSEIKQLSNSCVTRIDDTIIVDEVEIPTMNQRDFVSVKHIKNIFSKVEHNERLKEAAEIEHNHVETMLDKYKISISQILRTIKKISLGRRMKKRDVKALALIDENQKTGTGDWFCFINYANKQQS